MVLPLMHCIAMIRIRGIYTTALTRLLSDAGYSFSDITSVTRSRFRGEIKIVSQPPGVTIKDRNDLKGVIVLGDQAAVRSLSALISSAVPGSLGVLIEEGPYTTYLVKVVSEAERGYIVELPGGRRGLLEARHKLPLGAIVRAHVVRPSLKLPRLKEGLALVGRYVRIVEGGRHSVSKHVRDEERKIELLQLAFRNVSTRWGVKFRSSSAEAPLIDIAKEIQDLVREAERLLEMPPQSPSLLALGESLADIYFAPPATDLLDSLRGKQIPTLPLHHALKSLGEPGLDAKIDFAEESVVCSECFSASLVYRRHYLPRAGLKNATLVLHHVKLFGDGFLWTAAPRYDRENGVLLLERRVSSVGVYDGLGTRREPGDKILSYTYMGARVIVHEYLGRDGEKKGLYVNINTPLSLYAPGELWYIDMEVDIAWPPGQKPRIIDRDKFEVLKDKALVQPLYLALYGDYVEALHSEIASSAPNPAEILETARRKEDVFAAHGLSSFQ